MSDSTTPVYPAIPAPTTDTTALMNTALALKEAVESLTRQRGTPQVWAATVREVATGSNGDGNFPTNAAYLRGLVDQAISLVSSVSQGLGQKLDRTGGVMTGPLTLVGNPTAPMEPATRAYVDAMGTGDWTTLVNRPVAFPPKPHTHGINDIILLQVELDNRALVNHTQPWDTLTPPEGTTPVQGHRLTWDGTKLVLQPPAAANDGAGLWIAAAPPANFLDFPFWFDTVAGGLYVYYDDGNSAQWVPTWAGIPGAIPASVQTELDALRAENTTLTQRLTSLEATVAAIQA